MHAPISGRLATLVGLGTLLFVLIATLAIKYPGNPTDQTGPEIDELVFAQRLHKIAGPGSINCGLVRIDQDNTQEIECRDQALSQRHPFYYAFKTRYFRWWVGLAMDRSGKAWIVEFDHENPAAGTIRVGPCRPRTLGPTFTCSNWND
jgi:hypothetical protein